MRKVRRILEKAKPPVWIEIDTSAFLNNMRMIKSLLAPGCELIPVLKSDAYGHGMLELARAAKEEGLLGRIAIATHEEARVLRKEGFDNSLIKVVPSLPDELPRSLELNIEEQISSLATAQELSRLASEQGVSAGVHLAVDTGMGREGLLASFCVEEITRIAALPAIKITGLMTHFPSADEEDKEFTLRQMKWLTEVRQCLHRRGLDIPLCHVANSAAVLDMRGSHLDAVRAGLILYGMYPSGHDQRLDGIRPVMSMQTRIALLRTLPAHWPVGYGRTYTTASERLIATLPAGYANGYARHASNRAEVWIRGQRAPVVGRVSMNLVTVDVTDVPDVEVGDEVILFGAGQGEGQITADDLAAWTGTINYEVTTVAGRLNPRVYI
jgi:alanine racemase